MEAVVNGLQAIDTRFGDAVEKGRLHVRILRSPQDPLDFGSSGPGRTALKPIVGFSVEDNGTGFDPDNMKSFETLDSEFKAGIGCRGVGRLLWLKAFDRISVDSTYQDAAGSLHGRQFRFSVAEEIEHLGEHVDADEPGTTVSLEGFKVAFQQSAPKTIESIAREVFEHCIWYFLRPGGAPEVTVADDDGSVSLNALLEDFVFSEMAPTTVDVKGEKFTMVNLRFRSSTRSTAPRLYWCAANRVVFEENITGKVPGLVGRLKDEHGAEFTYVCYLSSGFLDERVRADRTAFDIDESVSGRLAADDVSFDDIREGVLGEVEKILDVPLRAVREEGKERVNEFVSRHAPRYRPVLARLEALGITVDPWIKDLDLELLLHRALQKLEADAIAEGQEVFAETGSVMSEDYQERLARYLDKLSDINQSDLAAYVSRRRVVLDLLLKLIRSDDDGKYSREDAVHSLLIPMRTDSNEIGPDASNLWIIDESLAFHDYLASDKTLKSMSITGDDSIKRPDILATRLADTPVLAAAGEKLPLPSLVVVEIKRPMRNDASEGKNPIEQCLGYVKRVRAGGVRTATGRPIPKSEESPAFCYIVADLTETMVERCEMSNLRPTHDGLGYFGFNEPAKAYIEVMSFDRLVNMAMERNRAFFDKLGLPSA
ncbi:hypothetical protein LO763_19790 [Glycomyces sp. A-F 0318]|nr:hypothetical protein [Glycomyces amatae]MCD0445855.1 hypothetical protein [Glycomyces amatae]